MEICEWLIGVEYDVYHNVLYLSPLLELWEFYEVVELLWWCCWWLYMCMCIYVVGEFSYMLLATIWWCKHVFKYIGELYMCMCIYVVGEFSYMLLATFWWCKHVLKYVGVDFGVDCVICTCILEWCWQIIYPYWWQLWCVCCIMRWWFRRWFGTTCI